MPVVLTTVRQTRRKGRGVFAVEDIPRGGLVFRDPVIVFPDRDARLRGVVHKYTFFWKLGESSIALGRGSLLNHSRWYNLLWRVDHAHETIVFRARWAIKAGEELTISYGSAPLGFKAVDEVNTGRNRPSNGARHA